MLLTAWRSLSVYYKECTDSWFRKSLGALVRASLLVALAPGALALLGEEDGLDVGQDAALGNGDAGQELVQLFVIPAQEGIV